MRTKVTLSGTAHTALPASRNTVHTAKRDEQKCLNAAVTAQVARTVLRDVIQQEIIAHVGILHAGGHIVKDLFRNADGVLFIADNLRRQRAKVRREADMRLKLIHIKIVSA